ncbi:MAG: hydrogenase maturation protease [Candidatus Kuenenia sp.]|nr:hydrogenase maturation protease [Candidatus Kuenenia hertensis]
MVKHFSRVNHAVLLIGIGNEHRSDDGVGLNIARRLKKLNSKQVVIAEHNKDGIALMETWKDFDTVIIIDAVSSGAETGTIFRFEAHTKPLPANLFHYSTHSFGIAEGIELARTLNQLPPYLIVYGIEMVNYDSGTGLSLETNEFVQKVTDLIQQEIHSLFHT